MPQPNAIQQVFNPATQRALLRTGLLLTVGLVIALAVALAIRMLRKMADKGGPANTAGGAATNPDGTPAPVLPQNLRRLADDLKQATGWTFICNNLRCDTILAMAELPDAQLVQLAAYFQSMYGQTLRNTFDGFYLSGCCLRDAGQVVDAKLKNIQERVAKLNI